MAHAVKKPRSTPGTSNVGLGRMLLLSLALHLLMFAVLGGFVVPRLEERKKPVYYVDLLHKPVAKPRAGRPDAAVVNKKKKPAAKKAVAKPKPKPPAKPVVKKQTPPAKPAAPVKKVVEKKTAVPVATEPAVVDNRYGEETLDAIEQLRRKQRIAELKNQLASLASEPSPAVTTIDAPVGVVGGTGTEAGVDFDSWIKEYLSQAWALPSHYHQRGLVAKMVVRFDSQGRRYSYEMLSPSGDTFFDASVKRAVQQLQQLPSAPGTPLELIVTFDPKEMLRP